MSIIYIPFTWKVATFRRISLGWCLKKTKFNWKNSIFLKIHQKKLSHESFMQQLMKKGVYASFDIEPNVSEVELLDYSIGERSIFGHFARDFFMLTPSTSRKLFPVHSDTEFHAKQHNAWPSQTILCEVWFIKRCTLHIKSNRNVGQSSR